MKSWKTTVAAILGVVVFALGHLGVEVASINNWGEGVGVVLGILGVGIQARDNDKTSEEAGAK